MGKNSDAAIMISVRDLLRPFLEESGFKIALYTGQAGPNDNIIYILSGKKYLGYIQWLADSSKVMCMLYDLPGSRQIKLGEERVDSGVRLMVELADPDSLDMIKGFFDDRG